MSNPLKVQLVYQRTLILFILPVRTTRRRRSHERQATEGLNEQAVVSRSFLEIGDTRRSIPTTLFLPELQVHSTQGHHHCRKGQFYSESIRGELLPEYINDRNRQRHTWHIFRYFTECLLVYVPVGLTKVYIP